MRVLFSKSKWEMTSAPLEEFLRRAREDGFDAVEIFLPGQSESAAEIAGMVSDHGLGLVAQMNTTGVTAAEHMESLDRHFAFAAATRPLLVNSQSGRDIFSFAENLRLFERGCELAREHGLTFAHETHRSRPLGSGPATLAYLQALPELKVTADFSHWFCAHESDLTDQPEAVHHAIQRAAHIHARIGFDQGPQIPDPLDPHWSVWTERHLELWQRIIAARAAEGCGVVCLTPEFGPPPYMPVAPGTGQPLADPWTVNVRFRDWLKEQL